MIGYEEIKDIFEDNENINENNYIEMLRNADYETKKNLAYKVNDNETYMELMREGIMDKDFLVELIDDTQDYCFYNEDFLENATDEIKDLLVDVIKEPKNYNVYTILPGIKYLFSKEGKGKERLDRFTDGDAIEKAENQPNWVVAILPYLQDEEVNEIVLDSKDSTLYDINEIIDIGPYLNSKKISDEAKKVLLSTPYKYEDEMGYEYYAKQIDFNNLTKEAKEIVINNFNYNFRDRIVIDIDNISKEELDMMVASNNFMEYSREGFLNDCIEKLSENEKYKLAEDLVEKYGINSIKNRTNIWDTIDEESRRRIINDKLTYEDFMHNSWTKVYLNEDTINKYRTEIDTDIDNYQKGIDNNHFVDMDIYEIATTEQRKELIKRLSFDEYEEILTKYNTDEEREYIKESLKRSKNYNGKIRLLYNISSYFDTDFIEEICEGIPNEYLFDIYNNIYEGNFPLNSYKTASLSDDVTSITSNIVKKRIKEDKSNIELLNPERTATLLKTFPYDERVELLKNMKPEKIVSTRDFEECIESEEYTEIMKKAFFNIKDDLFHAEKLLKELYKNGEDIDKYLDELSMKQKISLFKDTEYRYHDAFHDYLLNDILNKDSIVKDPENDVHTYLTKIFEYRKFGEEVSQRNIKIMEKLGFVDTFNSFNCLYEGVVSKEEKKYLIEEYKKNIDKIGELDYSSILQIQEYMKPEDKEIVLSLIDNYIGQKVDIDDSIIRKSQDINNKLFLLKLVDGNLYTQNNKEKIATLLENNEYVINSLNPNIFRPEFDDYDVELIERMTKVDGMVDSIISGLDSGKTQIFNMMLKTTLDGNDLEESLNVISDLYDQVYYAEDNKILDLIDGKITPKEAESLKEILLRKEFYDSTDQIDNYKVEINRIEDLDTYKQKFNDICEYEFNNTNDIEKKVDAFANRFYSMSFNEMERIVDSYYEGSIELGKKDEKYKDSEEYQFIANLNDLVSFVKDDNIPLNYKKDIINEYYNELNKRKQIEFSKEEVSILRNKCKGEISKELSSSLLKIKDIEPTSYKEYGDKQVPIIELNQDFKLLVHSLGAYGSVNEMGNYYGIWNYNSNINNHGICCSLISDEYMGTAGINDVVIAFDDFDKDALNTEAPKDIYSYNSDFLIESVRRARFHTSDELINASRSRYNEVNIERRELRNIESENKNIQPSCVVLFDKYTYDNYDNDGDFYTNALVCASNFNIPIVYIDKGLYSQKNMEEINKQIEEYKIDNDSQKLINISRKYNNCRCGDLVRGRTKKAKMDKVLYDLWEEKTKNISTLSTDEIMQIGEYVSKEELNYKRSLHHNKGRIPGISKKTLWEFKKNKFYLEHGKSEEEIIKSAKNINFSEDELKDINFINSFNNKGTDEEKDKFERELSYTIIQMEMLKTPESTRIDICNILRHHGIEMVKVGLHKNKNIIEEIRESKNTDEIMSILSNSISIEEGRLESIKMNPEYLDALNNIKKKVEKSYGIKQNEKQNNKNGTEKNKGAILQGTI